MMMVKLNRKGVSPIVAVLLLIIIAVAAAVVTYGFVMGFIGGATTTTATTQAIIRIEAVKASTTFVDVYVNNVGPIPVTVDTIYLYSANGTLAKTISVSQTISPGEVVKISGSISPQLVSPGAYYVKVVTKEGAVATSEVFRV